jgi:DNA-binding transcriptional MerR regulator
LDQRFYPIGQFAQKAAVSLRTLRYYDKVGLLSPSQYTEAGYRLYSQEDLLRLQQILAFKFLGFSLEEIKAYLKAEPLLLQRALAQQKAMLKDKRAQLDEIIAAVEQAQKLLENEQFDWNTLAHVIQVIQMEQKNDWVSNYLTAEQQQKIQEISEKSYTPEAREQFKAMHPNPWTEEDQKRVNEQYAHLAAELKRLVAAGADPASPDAQAAAKLQSDLILGFTKGNAEVTSGLQRFWKNVNELPEDQQPISLPYGKEEAALLAEATKIYRQRQEAGEA